MPSGSPTERAQPPAADALAAFIERHPRLFVLTGAGCSTESGIPAYRDADGDWRRARRGLKAWRYALRAARTSGGSRFRWLAFQVARVLECAKHGVGCSGSVCRLLRSSASAVAGSSAYRNSPRSLRSIMPWRTSASKLMISSQ